MNEGFEDSLEKPGPRRDYLKMVVRCRWHILVPIFACALLGCVVARLWPPTYLSEAMIIVEQQKVPEQYVTPNVVANLQTRMDAMKQQILSRTRLQRTIETFGLYPRERARMAIDDVVDKMRKAITVELVPTPGRPGEVTGFRISYASDRPATAQRITNELVSQFIDESLRLRAQQSESTTEFFESQLEGARRGLESQEESLREYKLRFLGELPEQEQGNLQILSSLQAQLYTAGGALERAEQQKTYLQSMMEQYRALSTPAGQSRAARLLGLPQSEDSKALEALDAQLLDLRTKLAQAEAKFLPMHPEVVELKGQIADLERTQKAMAKQAQAKSGANQVAAAAGDAATSVEGGLNSLETASRLKALDVEITNHKINIAKLEQQISEIQSHLKMMPVREQQLADITRTSENARTQYQSLLQKKLQSELANNLEKRQQGEQFRILDSASFPQKPLGRIKIIGAGWFLGLAAGIGLTLLLEILRPAIHGEKDVDLPASLRLFTIPTIQSPQEELRLRWVHRMEFVTGVLLLLASLGASIQTYLLT